MAFFQFSDVVAIMDMDGFVINKRFRCKELGVIKVGDAAAPIMVLQYRYS